MGSSFALPSCALSIINPISVSTIDSEDSGGVLDDFIALDRLNTIDDTWQWLIATLAPTVLNGDGGDDYAGVRFQSYNKLLKQMFS